MSERADPSLVGSAAGQGRLIDQALPEYDHVERHARLVAVSPAVVYGSMRRLPAGRIPLLRPLLALRRQPFRLGTAALPGGPSPPSAPPPPAIDWSRPLLDELLGHGFSLLAELPGQEVLIGAVGTFWKLGPPRMVPGLTLEQFCRFDRAGFNKVALDVRCQAEGAGARLSTETRIRSTDPRSARAFARYWWFVSWGSAAIRASWLRAVARDSRDRGDDGRSNGER